MALGTKGHGSNLLAGLANLSQEENNSDANIAAPTSEQKQTETIEESVKKTAKEVMEITDIPKEKTKVIKTKNVIEEVKNKPGRPRKYEKTDATVVLGIRVLKEEAKFLEKYGGEYGGKTGYVTHLIRKEMKRVNKD